VAEETEIPHDAAPPAGEPVHLPEPSLLPVVVAAGITLALVGVVLSLAVTAVGVLITVVAIVRWVRDVREDISDLPLDH
jgi:hypothetical protein